MKKETKNLSSIYYLGLDIGTDSVGYAVTDNRYNLKKYKGEPMWGTTTFEGANEAADRRTHRIDRRRVDRRKNRIQLINELFATEIAKVDSRFFQRIAESHLWREDTEEVYSLFPASGYTDVDYHREYPTIQHLLAELMNSDEPHDIRLVYLACIWLVAHRGHFLFDTPVSSAHDLMNFERVYGDFLQWLDVNDFECPWNKDIPSTVLSDALKKRVSVSKKTEILKETLYNGKKPSKTLSESGTTPFTQEAVVKLLAGATVKLFDIFQKEEYKDLDVKSVSLSMDDAEFASVVASIGDDGDLLIRLRAMNDCAMLVAAQGGKETLSDAKVAIYEQHKKDLRWLKDFIKKYCPDKYREVFLEVGKDNYLAYSYNTKSVKGEAKIKAKKTSKIAFCDYIRKIISKVEVEEADIAEYQDAMDRLAAYTFMPKQKDSDNRVIPYQLYYFELDQILKHAQGYLPFLSETGADGISVADKIRSVFTFKIPYFVGPLNKKSSFAWLERKAKGKIYPWNFHDMVDLDASEENFIRRMTNTCTYLPGEPVLPKNSLLYAEFMVLNEINNIKVADQPISVELKQKLFQEVFSVQSRVSVSRIQKFLIANNGATKDSKISGLDTSVKASYKPYVSFRRLLSSGTLNVDDAERIIERMAFTEDKARLVGWLAEHYPQINEDDRKYIVNLGFKDFGRLSEKFLTEIYHIDPATGEAFSIMDALRNTNDNLMQLLSERYTFTEQIHKFTKEYYSDPAHKTTLEDRLTQMRLSGAVKRPIYRTLDIVSDVEKAMGCAPARIFVEMARGGTEEQKGKRTISRKAQLLELYKKVRGEDISELMKQLEEMGDTADTRLQSDRLFLYYIQMGKCMYTGKPIELSQLGNHDRYDIDHIYPQSAVKDDSVLNNKVLVTSEVNGAKSDKFPISSDIQSKMHGFWSFLHHNGLINDEKFKRLTRKTPFTDEERYGFINRQLVETRQSTKAITQLLQERFGDRTEIVFVKARLASEFRQEFDVIKSRAVNDLHHAKDAYLNIVVGNVYHMRFSRRWFSLEKGYNIKTGKLFTHDVTCGKKQVWKWQEDLARVRRIMQKNNIHLTRYAFCRHGGLFDQQPVKAAEGLIPLKKGLPTEKYGGYRKSTASFYLLASYQIGRKKDIMFVPVELMFADRVMKDPAYAAEYVAQTISTINSGKTVKNVQILLNGRCIKINTVLSLDGMRVTLSGKSNGGANIVVKSQMPLVIGAKMERYVKRLDSFSEKKRQKMNVVLDSHHDGITAEKNVELYQLLSNKMKQSVYRHCPGNVADILEKGTDQFKGLDLEVQITCLLNIIAWFGAGATFCDLSDVGGKKMSGTKKPSAKLSNYLKNYTDIRIIDVSASGIFESRSENLLELL